MGLCEVVDRVVKLMVVWVSDLSDEVWLCSKGWRLKDMVGK